MKFKFESEEEKRIKPPKVPTEKGRGRKGGNPLDFVPEQTENEKFVNQNDPEKKFVPIEEVSSGDEWMHYGEEVEPEEDIIKNTHDSLATLIAEEEEIENKINKEKDILNKNMNLEKEGRKPSMQETRKIVSGMSPTKRFTSPKNRKNQPADKQIKTMPLKKKERATRAKIREFLHSQSGSIIEKKPVLDQIMEASEYSEKEGYE